MAIISSKHFKLSSFHFHKSKKTAIVTDSSVVSCKYNVAKLPKELLCCIYEQLETIECQNAFSKTCVAFHRIATDMRSNAAWVVTRYGPRFAIYYALLSFPQRCNSQFIQYMINLGAQVPRYLIQVLIQVYGKPMDSMIKSSENRRRRSSFHTFDLDLFFLKAVQELSFDGYATLIQHAFKFYGKIDINSNDLELFLTSLDQSSFNKEALQELITKQWFFPAPFSSTHANYRLVLKLAQSCPSSYDMIAPVFDFDPLARSSLWESILLLFFDEAFRSTEPTKEKQLQLELIQKSIIIHSGRHVHLAGPLNDQQIFCQVFATFFTKYPVGYCNQKTMAKLLRLLKMYVKPNFNIDVALEHMVQANIGRSDTIESVDKFLKASH